MMKDIHTNLHMYSEEITPGACLLGELSPTGVILSADDAFFAISGYAAEDLENVAPLHFSDLLHPGDVAEFWQQMRQGMDAEGVACCEHRLITRQGQLVFALTCARQLAAPEGATPKVRMMVLNLQSVPQVDKAAHQTLDALPCGIARFHFDPEQPPKGSNLRYANDMFFEIIGYTPERFAEERGSEIMSLTASDEDRALLLDARTVAARSIRKPVKIQYAITRGDGERAFILNTLIDQGPVGREHQMVCTYQDMTALMRTNEALAAQTEQVNQLIAAMHERIVEYDVDTDRMTLYADMSDAGSKDIIVAESLRGGAVDRYLHEEDVPALHKAMQEALDTPTSDSIEVRTILDALPAGHAWSRIYYRSVAGEDGRVEKLVGRIMNIDSEKRQELALREKAERDDLTGLYSRSTAEVLMRHYLQRENETQSDRHHAVMMIDLDNFKEINDQFSHAYGDVVLQEVAREIGDSFRATDIVGRLGGDEFIVLMKNYRTRGMIEQVASRICASVAKQYKTAMGAVTLSASVGVACYPEHGTSLEALYEHADQANHAAKAVGKNRWRIYVPGEVQHYSSGRRDGMFDARTLQHDVEQALLDTLHETDDRRQAIAAALEVMSRCFNAQRAYIVEFAEDGSLLDNHYRWHEEGYDFVDMPQNDTLRQEMESFCHSFDDMNMRIISDPGEFPQALRPYYQQAGVLSLLHYAFKRNGVVCGYIGVDDCIHAHRTPTPKLLNELSGVSRILTLFLHQRTPQHQSAAMLQAVELLDQLDSYLYLVDMDTHELVYMNKRMMASFDGARTGELCYRAICGTDAPCGECPLAKLQAGMDPADICSEMYFPRQDIWVKLFCGRSTLGTMKQRYCLFQGIDITQAKRKQLADGGICDEKTGI